MFWFVYLAYYGERNATISDRRKMNDDSRSLAFRYYPGFRSVDPLYSMEARRQKFGGVLGYAVEVFVWHEPRPIKR